MGESKVRRFLPIGSPVPGPVPGVVLAAKRIAEKVAGNRAFYEHLAQPELSRQVIRRAIRKRAKADAAFAKAEVIRNRRKKAVPS